MGAYFRLSSHLQFLKSRFLFASGTFDPPLDAVFLDMIRDLPPLNLLTTPRNTVNKGVLATSHVILEHEKHNVTLLKARTLRDFALMSLRC